MKLELEHKLRILEIVIKSKQKMRRLQISQRLVYEKNLRTRNCRRKFVKNLLPEKRKENM